MKRKKILTISIFATIWIIVVLGSTLGNTDGNCISGNCLKIAEASMPTNGYSSKEKLEKEEHLYEGEDPDSQNNEFEDEITYEEEETTDTVQQKQSAVEKEKVQEKKWWQFWK